MSVAKILVISGPSAGVGKDTIVKMLLQKHPDWQHAVSTTSRAPRPGEVNGKDMQFINKATFKSWQEAGEFLESFEVNGNLYGTLKSPLEAALKENKIVVLRKEPNGALAVKKALPQAVLVFIAPPSMEVLEDRLRKRATERETDIVARLKLAEKEMQFAKDFDHTVVNPTDHPELAATEIEKLILA